MTAKVMTSPSRAGTSASTDGFTFLELAVVLFIISLMLALVYPALRSRSSDSVPLRIASVLKQINEASQARKQNYSITFDMDNHTINWDGPDGKKTMDAPGLQSVTIPSRGEVNQGTLQVLFDYSGAPEDITVLLDEHGGKAYKVKLNEMSGRVHIENADAQ
ncbi:MAG: prepilin-type N-terminal cleavage/methylation domain-containing protein [Actinomycetota bacterium]|nr:prepilin-type N-terminal cleavage/methylation domain-containing protein [Actinomycetota bacterium]